MTFNSDVRRELMRQHDQLRHLLAACQASSASASDLDSLVERVHALATAFEAHNTYEEAELRSLLLEADAFGEVRVQQMLADHVAEHATLRTTLSAAAAATTLAEAARHVGAAATMLRDHLAAEEKQFLNPRVLRDDVVVADTTGG
jgi:hypothetical protein